MIDVLFSGSSDAVDYNAQPKNLDVLTHLATDYIDLGEGRRKLEVLVDKLNSTG